MIDWCLYLLTWLGGLLNIALILRISTFTHLFEPEPPLTRSEDYLAASRWRH